MEKIRDKKLKELEALIDERTKIKKLMKEYRIKEKSSAKSMRKYYHTKNIELSKRMEELDRKIKEIETEVEEGKF